MSVRGFKKAIEHVTTSIESFNEKDQKEYWFKTSVVIGVVKSSNVDYQAFCKQCLDLGFRFQFINPSKLDGSFSIKEIKDFLVRYNRTIIVLPQKRFPLVFYIARIIASNYISFFPQFYTLSDFKDTFLVPKK